MKWGENTANRLKATAHFTNNGNVTMFGVGSYSLLVILQIQNS